MKRSVPALAPLTLTALFAGCGSGGGNPSYQSRNTTPTAGRATIGTRKTGLGTILVEPEWSALSPQGRRVARDGSV